MFPGEEFLPRAPDPEEIAFDNHGTEPKQGDTFGGDENTEGEKCDGGDGGEEQGKKVGEEKEHDEQQGKEVQGTEQNDEEQRDAKGNKQAESEVVEE